jgi:hypothetical protein
MFLSVYYDEHVEVVVDLHALRKITLKVSLDCGIAFACVNRVSPAEPNGICVHHKCLLFVLRLIFAGQLLFKLIK